MQPPLKITGKPNILQRPYVLGMISLCSLCVGFFGVGLCTWLGFSQILIVGVFLVSFTISGTTAVFIPIAAGAKKLWQVYLCWLGFLLVAGLLLKLLMALGDRISRAL